MILNFDIIYLKEDDNIWQEEKKVKLEWIGYFFYL